MTTIETSTVIGTPYGLFRVIDARRPKGSDVARVIAVDGTFTINKKTYDGEYGMSLYRGYRGTYLNAGTIELTDSARAKLEEAFAPIADWLPPLTHEEKLAKVIESARSSVHSKLEYEVFRAADAAIQAAEMDYYSRGDDQLNEAEVAQVKAAVMAEVRAWLAEKEA